MYYHVYWIDCHLGEPHLGFQYESCISMFEAFKQIRFLYEQGSVACAWIRTENRDTGKEEIAYVATFVDPLGNRELNERCYGSYAG